MGGFGRMSLIVQRKNGDAVVPDVEACDFMAGTADLDHTTFVRNDSEPLSADLGNDQGDQVHDFLGTVNLSASIIGGVRYQQAQFPVDLWRDDHSKLKGTDA